MSDNLKQRAVSGAIWYGGSRFAIQGITWAITILVARILTPSDYGLMGFAFLVTGMADLISELGVGAAIIQRQDLDEEDLSVIFWFSLALSFFIYLIVWLAAPFVATFFKQQALVSLLRVVMLSFLINSLRIIPWNLLTKRMKFKHRSLIEVIANITGAFLTLGMAYAGFGVWSLAWGILIRQAMLTIGCQILLPWWPQWRFTWTSLRKVMSFGLTTSAGRVAWYAYSNADFLVVGKLLGQQLLGLYTMVWQLTMLPVDRISAIVNQVAYPTYAQLQNQPERFTRYFLKLTKLTSLITFPILAGLCLVADLAIPLLLTDRWSAIVAPIRIMTCIGMFSSVSVLIGSAVSAKGRPDLALKYNLVCLGVMPVGFVFGSQFGIMGVCWAWLILHPILTASWYVTTRKLLGYEWLALFNALKPALYCTLMMSVAVLGIKAITQSVQTTVAKLTVVIATGAISYTFVFIWGFSKQFAEFRQLFSRTSTSVTPS